MNFKSHLRLSALMLGLSLCGGLLNSAHAAPADGAAKPGKAGKAGKRGDGKGQRGGMGMKMMQELDLTDAQKAKLKPIMEAQRDQMKAMREDTTTAPADKRTKMKAMRAEVEKKANAILTSDQKKKLTDMKAKMKAEREAGGKDGADGAGRKGGKGRNGGPQAPAPAL